MSWDKETKFEYDFPLPLTGTPGELKIRPPPPVPVWAWSLDPECSTLFQVHRGPNVFHRFVQRWVLGIRWRRING